MKMAVVVQSAHGWVLDHEASINSSYTEVQDIQNLSNRKIKKRCNPELFEIWEPFRYESQWKALQEKSGLTVTDVEVGCRKQDVNKGERRKRRKKRKAALNKGEQAAIEYHEKVRHILKEALTELLTLSRQKSHLIPSERSETSSNNHIARKVARETTQESDILESLYDYEQTCHVEPGKTIMLSEAHEVPNDPNFALVNVLVKHESSRASVRDFFSSKFFLPSKCAFLMSDITYLQPLLQEEKFDVVVLDPPWQNKSVKRKKTYNMLSDEQLLQLPVVQLTKPGSLVVVWVTNRQQQHKIVRDTLFPAWNVHFLTQWFWLKVTKAGALIYDLDSTWKKPYEVLILGRVGLQEVSKLPQDSRISASGNTSRDVEDSARNSPESNLSQAQQTSSSTMESQKSRHETVLTKDISVPEQQVILSVPCSIHSRKPPLNEVLQPFLPSNPRCLELFARNLLPGWTSWGNQVLMFQHERFFKEVTS